MNRAAAIATALVLSLGAACAAPGEPAVDPAIGDAPPANPTPALTPADPASIELLAEVATLEATLTAALDEATAVRTAADLPAGRAAAERLVHLLTAAPDLQTDLDDDDVVAPPSALPLFPGPRDDIPEDAEYDVSLARAATAGRDAGADGARLLSTLCDPIAGDVAIWFEDAAGMLDLIDEAARARSVEEAEAAVATLDGEATRALAYALLALRARDVASAQAYGERAAAHLDLGVAALAALATNGAP